MLWLRRLSIFKHVGLVLAGVLIAVVISQRSAQRPVQAEPASAPAPAPQAVSDPQAGRTGFDPLSTAEQDLAAALAAPAIAQLRGAKAQGAVEPLLVERHEEDKQLYLKGAWDRRADVLVYDYASDRLIQSVVNLTTKRVDATTAVRDVQPLITAAERDRALALALADPTAGPGLRGWYQRVTKQTLDSPAQLRVDALVFRADAMADSKLGRNECGVRRCAQLLFATAEGQLIDVTVYVDLSRGAVFAVQQ